MALSMDEQRMLAEIERRLAAEDPGLATRLTSFRRRPGPAAALRTPRGRIIGSLCTVFLLAVIGLTVYAMIPFRAQTSKATLSRQTAVRPTASAPVRSGPNSETTASAKASTGSTASAKASTGSTADSTASGSTAG
jgi:cytoskeletal protein RodZ